MAASAHHRGRGCQRRCELMVERHPHVDGMPCAWPVASPFSKRPVCQCSCAAAAPTAANAPTQRPFRSARPPRAGQDFCGGHVPGAVNWEVDNFNDDSGIDEVRPACSAGALGPACRRGRHTAPGATCAGKGAVRMARAALDSCLHANAAPAAHRQASGGEGAHVSPSGVAWWYHRWHCCCEPAGCRRPACSWLLLRAQLPSSSL